MLLIALLTLGLGAPVANARPRHKVPDIRSAPRVRMAPRRVMTIPLTVHVASHRGRALVSNWRVRAWVDRANDALRPHGIRLELHAVKGLPGNLGTVTRWRHRRALAAHAPHDGTAHVFVVDRLELFATHRGDRSVRGMHWRYRGFRRGLTRREYVVVTGDAPRTTLVHEVGHLFGLRHDARMDNLMCSCRRGPSQLFSRTQGQQMRRGARRFLQRSRR